jgi:hypothetical protein
MAFPAFYNFFYYRGDTLQFVIRPKVANGSAFNLSGYTAAFTIANQRGSSATQTAAVATINTSTNIVTCTITPAVGITLNPVTFVYDVQITDGTQIYTILTGEITVVDHVTGAV